MRRFLVITTAALLVVAAISAARAANDYEPIGGVVLPPTGWLQFCKTNPQECTGVRPATIRLTPATLATLKRVNREVNGNITYAIQKKWDFGHNGRGDCKAYALQKRRELAALGLPLGALLPTISRRDGAYHMFLTVRTNQGDLILDLDTDQVRGWRADPFLGRLIMRLEGNHWVAIRDPRHHEAVRR